jgi:hypothetical protein
MTPRASFLHRGANKPLNAGTKYSPPVSSTVRDRVSMSADVRMMPRLSRSHCNGGTNEIRLCVLLRPMRIYRKAVLFVSKERALRLERCAL